MKLQDSILFKSFVGILLSSFVLVIIVSSLHFHTIIHSTENQFSEEREHSQHFNLHSSEDCFLLNYLNSGIILEPAEGSLIFIDHSDINIESIQLYFFSIHFKNIHLRAPPVV